MSTIGRSGFKNCKKIDLTRTNSVEVAANIFNVLNAGDFTPIATTTPLCQRGVTAADYTAIAARGARDQRAIELGWIAPLGVATMRRFW